MNSWVIMDELRRIWKMAVVAYYKALFWHFPELDKENHERSDRIGQYQDWNPGSLRHLLEVLLHHIEFCALIGLWI
jgi:hypothetical protein